MTSQDNKKHVVLLSSQIAPFQAELANAINERGNIRYTVLFLKARNDRPKHWLEVSKMLEAHTRSVPSGFDERAAEKWALEQLEDIQPDALLVGGIRGPQVSAALHYKRRTKRKIWCGYWMEQPLVRPNGLMKMARFVEYLYRLSRLDFVIGIGDRAHAYYRLGNRNAHFVPYGSDLSVCLKSKLSKQSEGKMKFLFSGGLHPRHNFQLIMEGFQRVVEAKGPCFELIISGDGPEQKIIDAYCENNPELKKTIRYVRVFDRWQDRLNPFLESDVFIYPTQHAGWGIVVPEAMAAGLAVISSNKAEASRYLIDHERSGMIVEEEIDDFTNCLIRCIDNPTCVSALGQEARKSAQRCHAPYVAEQLTNTLRIATNGEI